MLLTAFLCSLSVYSQIVDAQKGANGKYGFVDKNGKWVISPIYAYAYWSDSQYGTFKETSIIGKEGAVNKWGKVITPCLYEDIFMSYDKELGRYEVRLQKEKGDKELWGIYEEKNWKEIIPVKYEDIWKDGTNFYEVTLNGKVGYLDIQGKQVIPCEYGYVRKDEDWYWCKIGDKEGCCNKEGELIVPVEYKSVLWNGMGFSVKTEDGWNGYIDAKGKVIIPANKYTSLIREGNYFIVGINSHKGFCDINGKELVSPNLGYSWENSKVAGENIFLVEKDGKYGYYANGQEIIPCQYDYATVFTNDVATVKKDGEVKMIKNPLKDESKILLANNVIQGNKKKAGGPAVSRYPAPNSDVDKDIPAGKQSNENTFAFIIANENYPDAPVPYALNDGRIFKEYCNKTLGIPEKNISLYEDATFGNIITAMEKMKDLADAFDGEASVILYYAGHGFPDEKQSTAYLLPVDGNASDITTTGYSLAKLYKDLASLKLKSSVVFLDACFSGAKREDNMLASFRGVAIKVKEEAPTGNMVVFSAAQGDETAHQMEEKGHGLFTYYLLKELQQTNGDVTLGALAEYVTKQVKRQSVVINNKKQTPTVVPSESLLNSWQDKKLK